MQSYVLMIRADEDDQFFTETILEEMRGSIPMHFIKEVPDVEQTLAVQGIPSVILVNNRDHRHKTIDVVSELKSDPRLAHIPVVVLGEITTPEFIHKYYRAGASSYIIKPSSLAATRKKIGLFFAYWFEVAEV
ncbi:MAG: response regulator [Chitinophagaceae bacterium]|nr:MAG: response regulator [Chitinophagaceae bacterium]